MFDYQQEAARLSASITQAGLQVTRIRLKKSTSNLFRHRLRSSALELDVHRLNIVMGVDEKSRLAEVAGMTTYSTLVGDSLRHNLLPCVTPELKTITVGGAVSGLGIESSSFRYGLVHETVQEMDVLVGDGSVVRCSREENADLFHALPNSYGTLGYILRAVIRLFPALPYVQLHHRCLSEPSEYFAALETAANDPATDFLDGMVLDDDHLYLTTAAMLPSAPSISDYTYTKVFYKSIPEKSTDYLRTFNYIWRWDTDWFWCSQRLGMQNPFVRALATPLLLNSATYQKLMRLSHRLLPSSNGRTESVIQDVQIPANNAGAFLRFLLHSVPIRPVWICPFCIPPGAQQYTLCPMPPGRYINFGFWDVVPAQPDPTHYNREIEHVAAALDGRKALYSSCYYENAEFRRLIDYSAYEALKRKYDPRSLLGDLYGKCVLRH